MQFSLIFVLALALIAERICPRASKVRASVQKLLFWNGSIRLFMEGYLDIALFSMLNIYEEYKIEGLIVIDVSNITAYCMLALCGGVPIVLLIHGFIFRK